MQSRSSVLILVTRINLLIIGDRLQKWRLNRLETVMAVLALVVSDASLGMDDRAFRRPASLPWTLDDQINDRPSIKLTINVEY